MKNKKHKIHLEKILDFSKLENNKWYKVEMYLKKNKRHLYVDELLVRKVEADESKFIGMKVKSLKGISNEKLKEYSCILSG